MREKFSSELKAAMKAGERRRVDTIRMIMAALKDKDIEARGQGKAVSGEDILGLLQKMVKSRKESLEIYEKAGRTDLATQESEEIAIIQEFLPSPLSEAEVVRSHQRRHFGDECGLDQGHGTRGWRAERKICGPDGFWQGQRAGEGKARRIGHTHLFKNIASSFLSMKTTFSFAGKFFERTSET